MLVPIKGLSMEIPSGKEGILQPMATNTLNSAVESEKKQQKEKSKESKRKSNTGKSKNHFEIEKILEHRFATPKSKSYEYLVK